MRKFIFTLVLAIAGSVWTMSAQPQKSHQSLETITGTMNLFTYPCEQGIPCPEAMVTAMESNSKIYYLEPSNEEIALQMDALQRQFPLRATISGSSYKKGSFDFFKVVDIILYTVTERWCIPPYRTLTEPYIMTSGTLQQAAFPCEADEEDCPDCLTIVLETNEGTLYLVSDNTNVIEALDNAVIGSQATIDGVPFRHGNHSYVDVHNIQYTTPQNTGDDPGSSTIDPDDPNQATILLQNGQVVIKKGDQIYTITGQEVK